MKILKQTTLSHLIGGNPNGGNGIWSSAFGGDDDPTPPPSMFTGPGEGSSGSCTGKNCRTGGD